MSGKATEMKLAFLEGERNEDIKIYEVELGLEVA
jgi:hypothetical protein